MEWLTQVDAEILRFIQTHFHNQTLTMVMTTVSLFSASIWFCLGVIGLFFKKTRESALYSLVGLALSFIIVHLILKPWIARPRPFVTFSDLEPLITKPKSFSFPSGHSASAFAAIGGYCSKGRPLRTFLLILFASSIAFSRLYLKVHFPSDVIVGILIGIICSYLANFMRKKATTSIENML